VLGNERDPRSVTVREIMRTPVAIAQETDDATLAIERMKVLGVRRIPVIGRDRKLVGIVCLDDLWRQLAADANALAEVVTRQLGQEHRARR
jgi:CBS domain-containing protein